MPAFYSFLDVAVMDEVRERFASGQALAILSTDIAEIIWANGPGASFLGYADIAGALGSPSGLAGPARRQIMATRGFPEIGANRTLMVRFDGATTITLQASAVRMPDGEPGILLALPSAKGGGETARAIGGFAQDGNFVAFVDGTGRIEAASEGFSKLGISVETLKDLADAAAGGDRLVKRMLPGAGATYPAGMARLSDQPVRHLLVVIDDAVEVVRREAEDTEADDGEIQAPSEADAPDGAGRDHNGWYFSADGAEAGTRDGAAEGEREGSSGVPSDDAEPGVLSDQPAIDPEMEELSGAAETEPTPVTQNGLIPMEEGEAGPFGAAPQADGAATPPVSGVAADALHGTAPAHADDVAASVPPAPEDAIPGTEAGPSIDRTAAPARFVWRTDAEGRFSQISPEFAGAVGDAAADVLGRRFRDLATTFGIDPDGEIQGLLERRDTWSGRSVLWPVAGTRLRIPVDLAALPVYSRDRSFEGFRGFGVARPGDASDDPEGLGMALVAGPLPAPQPAPWPAETRPAENSGEEPATERPADPFKGELPALALVPTPERRSTDKIIRLAEHRLSAAEGLSQGERTAFKEIGDRLRKDSGPSEPPTPAVQATDPADRTSVPPAEPHASGPTDAAADGLVDAAAAAETLVDVLEPTGTPEPEYMEELQVTAEAVGPAEKHVVEPPAAASLPADWSADDDESPPSTANAPQEMQAAVSPEQAAETVEPAATPVPAEAAVRADEVRPARPRGRPSLSLLDFTDWNEKKPAGAATGPAATAEAEDVPDVPSDTHLPAHRGSEQVEPANPAETPGISAESGDTPPETDEAASVFETANADQTPASTEMPDSVPAPEKQDDVRPATDTSILDRMPIPVLIHSGDRLHYANKEFLDLTGHGSVEALAEFGGLGALFAEPYQDEDAPERRDRKLRLKTAQGADVPVEAFLQSVPWNGGKALMLVLRRAEESGPAQGFTQSPLFAELEARVAEMRTIIDTATDGVVLIAPDGSIRSISRPAEALFGFESDDVKGRQFSSLFAVESQRAARDYLAGLSDNGVASVLNDGREVIGRESEGRYIPLFMTIGRLQGDSGYCAVVRDITQWKRAEEELTKSRAQAERASSQKTDFLARISHEIRTPLNAIIGFSELMMDEKFGPIANDRYRDYLRDINRSGNHVLDLVNDLLDISKIEAGQQEMSYEAVSLNDALAETVAMMQPQANRERVIIRSSFASKLPDVVADLRSVRQIALNILSNAIRYTQAGGQVIVSTAYETSGDVVMRVRDTGVGMSQGEIEQALKPFKQINSLKRPRGDGTGLGLPLTKAMVEANRAIFSIDSTPGEGTLVEITFPSTRVLAE